MDYKPGTTSVPSGRGDDVWLKRYVGWDKDRWSRRCKDNNYKDNEN